MACIGKGPAVGQQGEVYPSILEEAKWPGAGTVHFP